MRQSALLAAGRAPSMKGGEGISTVHPVQPKAVGVPSIQGIIGKTRAVTIENWTLSDMIKKFIEIVGVIELMPLTPWFWCYLEAVKVGSKDLIYFNVVKNPGGGGGGVGKLCWRFPELLPENKFSLNLKALWDQTCNTPQHLIWQDIWTQLVTTVEENTWEVLGSSGIQSKFSTWDQIAAGARHLFSISQLFGDQKIWKFEELQGFWFSWDDTLRSESQSWKSRNYDLCFCSCFWKGYPGGSIVRATIWQNSE